MYSIERFPERTIININGTVITIHNRFTNIDSRLAFFSVTIELANTYGELSSLDLSSCMSLQTQCYFDLHPELNQLHYWTPISIAGVLPTVVATRLHDDVVDYINDRVPRILREFVNEWELPLLYKSIRRDSPFIS